MKKILNLEMLRKGLQIRPKSETLIFFSKTDLTISWFFSRQELMSDVTLSVSQEIRKYHESLKTSYKNSVVPSLPVKMKTLLILAKSS